MPIRQKKKKADRDAERKKSEKVIAAQQKSLRSFILQEKEIVPKCQELPSDHFGHHNVSPLWKFAVHIDWVQFSAFVSSHDPQNLTMYKGFQRINEAFKAAQKEQASAAKKFSNKADYKTPFSFIAKRCVLCPLCMKDPETPLSNAVVMLTGKPSNIKQHTDGKHKDFVIPGTKDDPNEPEQPSPTQTTMTMYRGDGSGMITKRNIRQQMQQHIYQCVNDCCLPASIVEKPEFRKMIDFAIKNANLLRESRPEVISRREVTSMRVASYQDFIRTVSKLSYRVRQHYKKVCRQEIPFATVCHDVWQAKKYDVLGVTVMFCDPRNCAVYRIPIGLAQTKGHTAVQVARLTHSLLQTVGFHKSDLCSSVNDNTASAVLAGKYITGSSNVGKCDMHKAELVLKHATGLVVRTRDKRVVDDNKAFVELYSEFKNFAAWLMSKKANHRFDTVRTEMERMNQSVVQIPLPNETRVSGCVLTIQYLLRNKWCFDDYASRHFGTDPDFKESYPQQEQWETLAQYEAILVVLQEVSISIQSDEPGSSSAALMQIYLARSYAHRMKNTVNSIGCLPVKLTTPVNKRWNGDITISQLDRQRDPMSFGELKAGPRTLIRRIIAEFKTLLAERRRVRDDGGSINDDSEKALMAHPLMTNIFVKFFQSLGVYDQNDGARVKEIFLRDMIQKFSNKSYSRIGSLMATQQQSGTPTTQSNTTQATNSLPTANVPFKKFNAFRNFRESQELNERALLNITGKASAAEEEARVAKVLRQTCEDSLRDFRRACKREIDGRWQEAITKYPTEAYTTESKKWKGPEKAQFIAACQDTDFLVVGKYFDVMGWWEKNKDNYQHVFPTAVIWLTKPATNAFQERVFSLGSWFQQNKLQTKTTAKNFEMRAMEKLTRKIRLDIIQREIALENQKKEQDVIVIEDDEDDDNNGNTTNVTIGNDSREGGDNQATTRQDATGTKTTANEAPTVADEHNPDATSTPSTEVGAEAHSGPGKKRAPHLFENTEQAEYVRNMLLKEATKELEDFNAKKNPLTDILASSTPEPVYEYYPDLGDDNNDDTVPMPADDIQPVSLDLSDVSDHNEESDVEEDIDTDEAITVHLQEEMDRLESLERSRKQAVEERKRKAMSQKKDDTAGSDSGSKKKRKANQTPTTSSQKKAKQSKIRTTSSSKSTTKKTNPPPPRKRSSGSEELRRSPRQKKKKANKQRSTQSDRSDEPSDNMEKESNFSRRLLDALSDNDKDENSEHDENEDEEEEEEFQDANEEEEEEEVGDGDSNEDDEETNEDDEENH